MVGDWLGFRLWDPYTGEPLTSYVKLGEGMRGACFLDQGRILRVVTMNANVYDYEVNGLPPQQQRIQGVTSVLPLDDGKQLWMAQNNGLSQWGEQDGAYEQRVVVGGFDGECHLVKGSNERLVAALDYTYPKPSRLMVFQANESGVLSEQPTRTFTHNQPKHSGLGNDDSYPRWEIFNL